MYSFGDILIINFPFSDGQGSKRRPVMVIRDTKDKDLLIAKVTSQQYNSEINISLHDCKQAGLLSPSVVRIHKNSNFTYFFNFWTNWKIDFN